jgi:tRNA uridine 5-carboxymethylaminomethyl modification enzyme
VSEQHRPDIIVVGAGHAGIEAALAAARLGAKVCVVTLRLQGIGQMSCNPAVGGVGKGHLVREIDALGGAMGRVADATALQARRLNLSRGPAVRSTRVQSDAPRYKAAMAQLLVQCPNLTVIEDEVVDLITATESCGTPVIRGVRTRTGVELLAAAVVITTGTFMGGLCHIGEENFAGGRVGDRAANALSAALRRLGMVLGRFKTGTTPRLEASSIDWDALQPQVGDVPPPQFSFDPVPCRLPQQLCYMTATTAETHALVRDNLQRSALYCGQIQGRGPRYCPSLEDKVVRFASRTQHPIFLEPEGLDSSRIYPNGLSTSLPRDVQEAFVRTLPGLHRALIVQHGYAVEYDYAPPTQLTAGLMSKLVRGLFLAGQINGTSGYEEAAAQGLMGGLNAARYVAGMGPAVLRRDQGYIGVLIDDLVTRGVDEPYRIFTSRAEHRLTLRESNAEVRLHPVAQAWGLVDSRRHAAAVQRGEQRQALTQWLQRTPVKGDVPRLLQLQACDTSPRLADLLKRTDVSLDAIMQAVWQARSDPSAAPTHFDAATRTAVEDEIKYVGYINREARDIARLSNMEEVRIPAHLHYAGASGLSAELQEKLQAIRPTTLGQASRIPGMTPPALRLLRVHLHRAPAA